MRFVLDQDVDADVIGVLVSAGHDAWSVGAAGLHDASDDEVSVYASRKDATVITHDVEFSTRRRRNPHGRHVQLRCREMDAAEVLEDCIDQLVAQLLPHEHVFAKVSRDGVTLDLKWS